MLIIYKKLVYHVVLNFQKVLLFSLIDLEALISLKNSDLRYLELSNCSQMVNLNSLNSILLNSSKLEILDLAGCKNVDGSIFEKISEHMTCLRWFTLTQNDKIVAEDLAPLCKVQSLELLSLAECTKIRQNPLTKIILSLKNLQRVDVAKIEQFGCDIFEDEEIDKNLLHPRMSRSINMSSCGFSSPEKISRFFSHFPNICSVAISGCDSVEDKIIESICNECKSIHALDITHCTSITDKSLSSISKLPLRSLVAAYFVFVYSFLEIFLI